MTKFLLATVDNSSFQMQVAHPLLANKLTPTINDTIMAKKTAKKITKKAAKKAAKKTTTKKATKKTTIKKAAKKTTTKKAAKKIAKKAAKKKTHASVKKTAEISHEQISPAAYLNYISRTAEGIHGDHAGDWLAAETSLRNTQK
jgi:hypothetical protein